MLSIVTIPKRLWHKFIFLLQQETDPIGDGYHTTLRVGGTPFQHTFAIAASPIPSMASGNEPILEDDDDDTDVSSHY